MLKDQDHYEAYYSDKLWNLIPETYRAEDSVDLETNGPLREIVARIGAHVAVVRRSIDRMLEDQSIESCDDWLIPYIADLLRTRLAPSLDARGQRLNVAKTIYYRRRKGTVGVIEELSSDITGWEIRVVEFFRRLSRNRHSLDPMVGPIPVGRLQEIEGLVGPLSGTMAGGFACLRSVDGASKCGSAFDDYNYSADVRPGRGGTGWHNINRIGIFAWRLKSYGVARSTPVEMKDCPGQFTFDPTGRQIQLFAAAARQEGNAYNDQSGSPDDWQLPAPISAALLEREKANLWSVSGANGSTDLNSLGIFHKPGIDFVAIDTARLFTDSDPASNDPEGVILYPDIGRYRLVDPTQYGTLYSTYHYGFASEIGAGPYDRRELGGDTIPTSGLVGGVNVLSNALTGFTRGEVVLGDSLTYDAVKNLTNITDVSIRSANKERPVLRPAVGTNWQFTGLAGSSLLLDGMYLAAGRITLSGDFDTVRFRCCTLDPGNWNDDLSQFVQAVDGRQLRPVEVVVRGQIRNLVFERCICGPVSLGAGGSVEEVALTDSIVQMSSDSKPALSIDTGLVSLERVTVLGRTRVNRIYASNSILADRALVKDTQRGCIRFCAYTDASIIPSPYESVAIRKLAPIFSSREFANAGFCQLHVGADRAILYGAEGRTISSGAEDGSEMGAFNREKSSIKERSLLLKLEEFLPLGLAPVIIYET